MLKALPACVALFLVATTGRAQVPVGAEFRVNTYTTGSQAKARVSASPSGNFVAVWQTNQNDLGDIYARRYASTGAPIGGEFPVSSAGGYERNPAVAMAATGEFVVVWTGSGYSNTAIKGRRYDALGNPGAEFHVNSYVTNVQDYPAIALDANRNFVVVWASTNQDGDQTGIFGRRFDASGTPIGFDFAVNSYTTGRQERADVAMGTSGDFVVVWHSNIQDAGGYGVFGQRFTSGASPVGNEFQVNTTTAGIHRNPAVASQAAGDFVVVWAGPSGPDYGIVARRFSASGIPASGEFLVNQPTASGTDVPAVASDRVGNFCVSWADVAQDGDAHGVFARLFHPVGAAVGPEFQVNTYTTSFQTSPSVALDAHGRFVVAWVSAGQDSASSSGVFGQRYSDLIFGNGFDPAP